MSTRWLIPALLALLLLPAACASQAVTGAASPRQGTTAKDFEPKNFSRSTTVDNTWLPLRPGTQFVYTGSTNEGKKRVRHRLVSIVTDLTKVVGGVRSVVTWDRDYSEGQLVEAELSFFAQDNAGNVWHLGEYPEEYEDGKFVKAPAWIAGLKGARAGIEMKAKPRLGTPSYSQGFAPPPVNWRDRAKVEKTGEKTCVPVACYRDVLVTREFNKDEPGQYQLKFYARGVGNVRVGWGGPENTDKEVLVMAKLVRLSPAGLAGIRREALKLEKHAYVVSKNVYGRTPPARRGSP